MALRSFFPLSYNPSTEELTRLSQKNNANRSSTPEAALFHSPGAALKDLAFYSNRHHFGTKKGTATAVISTSDQLAL